mmetsp:Transcript_31023/g.101144  ORF Transcript_31023/g.101144 Transcript_31023/m.101144 type:complete len:838 (+) Transcript_31023:242-2755(+)
MAFQALFSSPEALAYIPKTSWPPNHPQQQPRLLLATIAEIYREKIRLDAKPFQDFPSFIYDYMMRKYGLPKLAEKAIIEMLCTVSNLRFESTRIALYGRFIGLPMAEALSLETLQEMLRVQGAVEEQPPAFPDKVIEREKIEQAKWLNQLKGSQKRTAQLDWAAEEREWVSLQRMTAGIRQAYAERPHHLPEVLPTMEKSAVNGGTGGATWRKTDMDVLQQLVVARFVHEQNSTKRELEQLFTEADENGDGVLTFDEFSALIEKIAPGGVSMMQKLRMFREALQQNAEDGDGESISPESFSTVVVSYALLEKARNNAHAVQSTLGQLATSKSKSYAAKLIYKGEEGDGIGKEEESPEEQDEAEVSLEMRAAQMELPHVVGTSGQSPGPITLQGLDVADGLVTIERGSECALALFDMLTLKKQMIESFASLEDMVNRLLTSSSSSVAVISCSGVPAADLMGLLSIGGPLHYWGGSREVFQDAAGGEVSPTASVNFAMVGVGGGGDEIPAVQALDAPLSGYLVRGLPCLQRAKRGSFLPIAPASFVALPKKAPMPNSEQQKVRLLAAVSIQRKPLKRVFQYYAHASVGFDDPFTMNIKQFSAFVADIELLAEKELAMLTAGVFGTCASGKEMNFPEFLHAVVMLSDKVDAAKTDGSAASKVARLVRRFIIPNASRIQEDETFKVDYALAGEAVFKEHEVQLRKYFNYFASKGSTAPMAQTSTTASGKVQDLNVLIDAMEWVAFLKRAGLIGPKLSLPKAMEVFMLANGARLAASEEEHFVMKEDEDEQQMDYDEFLYAVALTAKHVYVSAKGAAALLGEQCEKLLHEHIHVNLANLSTK